MRLFSKKFESRTFTGMDFRQVAKALNRFNNFGKGFLEQRGFDPLEVVAVANHSYGDRVWFPRREGSSEKPVFFEEHVGHYKGWHVLREEDVGYIEFTSNTSGAILRALHRTGDNWDLTIQLMVGEDGEPIHSRYEEAFEEAITLPPRPRPYDPEDDELPEL